MPLYTFLHNLLTILVQIANKMGLQKMQRKTGEIILFVYRRFKASKLLLRKIMQEDLGRPFLRWFYWQVPWCLTGY
jgi:hypothetical protein